MLPVSGNVNAQPRKLSCKLVIGSNTITDVKLLTYSSDWSGNITVGQVVSSYISVTVPTPSFSLAGANVSLSMGIGDPVEWVLIGNFRISEESIRTRQGYTSFKAFDKLYSTINTYHTALSYPTTLQAIFNEVCTQIGVNSFNILNTLGIVRTFQADSEVLEDLDGYTLRDVLGFIGGYCGRNVYLAPNGADLQFRWFTSTTYDADNYKANVPYIGENDCTVSRLICQTQNGVKTTGSGEGIYFTCPFMDQTRLNAMLSGLSLTYRKADVDIPYGNFCLQSGDIITVSTVTGQTLTVPIMNNSWTYDGGVSSAVSAYGVSDYSGTANNAERSLSVRRVQRKMAVNRAHSELETATKIITGASGGYIKINFGGDGKTAALLIMDTNDITTAQNVWVFNQNGLGHFPNGYDVGNVNLALTMDGTVVAERIAGTMISGVGIENVDNALTTKPKIALANGCIHFTETYSYDGQTEQVTDIGKMEYLPRSGQNNPATIALTCQYGNKITIGEYGYPKYVYTSSPTGIEKMHTFYGDVKFYDGVYFGDSLISSSVLADIVDSGAKNIADMSRSNSGSQGIITRNGDTITISGSQSSGNAWYNMYYAGTGTLLIPPGKYAAKLSNINSDIRLRALNQNGTIITGEWGEPITFEIPSGSTGSWIRFDYKLNTSYNISFQLMVCPIELWNVSQAFQPYRPSYQELYERVVALENQ